GPAPRPEPRALTQTGRSQVRTEADFVPDPPILSLAPGRVTTVQATHFDSRSEMPIDLEIQSNSYHDSRMVGHSSLVDAHSGLGSIRPTRAFHSAKSFRNSAQFAGIIFHRTG